MTDSEKQSIKSRFIAFAALLQAAIASGYKFPFSKTLKETGLFHLSNGCKCMKKILTQEQQLIDIDDYGIPSFVEGKISEGLLKDAVKFADRLILYVDDYNLRYAENRKQVLTAKKAKLNQYVYQWYEGRKQKFAIVNAETKPEADSIFSIHYSDNDNVELSDGKKLNSANKITELNKMFL